MLEEKNGKAWLWVKVIPKSSANAIVGIEEPYLKIRLKAVPDRGQANAALVKFLSDVLNLTPSRIKILKGHTSRLKVLELSDVDVESTNKTLLKLNQLDK